MIPLQAVANFVSDMLAYWEFSPFTCRIVTNVVRLFMASVPSVVGQAFDEDSFLQFRHDVVVDAIGYHECQMGRSEPLAMRLSEPQFSMLRQLLLNNKDSSRDPKP
jgi:hypothetical protein